MRKLLKAVHGTQISAFSLLVAPRIANNADFGPIQPDGSPKLRHGPAILMVYPCATRPLFVNLFGQQNYPAAVVLSLCWPEPYEGTRTVHEFEGGQASYHLQLRITSLCAHTTAQHYYCTSPKAGQARGSQQTTCRRQSPGERPASTLQRRDQVRAKWSVGRSCIELRGRQQLGAPPLPLLALRPPPLHRSAHAAYHRGDCN